MNIFVVGSGKLAQALLDADMDLGSSKVSKWSYSTSAVEKSILIHAGSGRELNECIEFCERTDSLFVELSTGLYTEAMTPNFTLIVCPNTSLLTLSVLQFASELGKNMENFTVSITESHQASKTSAPGTAFNLARFLRLSTDKVKSIRDKQIQSAEIGIPTEYLDKHAYHKIKINSEGEEIVIETKILGHGSYVRGVEKIIDLILKRRHWDKRKYSVLELFES